VQSPRPSLLERIPAFQGTGCSRLHAAMACMKISPSLVESLEAGQWRYQLRCLNTANDLAACGYSVVMPVVRPQHHGWLDLYVSSDPVEGCYVSSQCHGLLKYTYPHNTMHGSIPHVDQFLTSQPWSGAQKQVVSTPYTPYSDSLVPSQCIIHDSVTHQ